MPSRFRARLLTRLLIASGAMAVAACGGDAVVSHTGAGGGSGGDDSVTTASANPTGSSPNHRVECFELEPCEDADCECPSTAEAYEHLVQQVGCIQIYGDVDAPEGECCYDVAYDCGTGRPFVDQRSTARAQTVAAPLRRGGEWAGRELVPETSGLSDGQRSALAKSWGRDARYEHASVASFGRFALELMAVGAPAELIAAAHEAALDEVRHAQACFALASTYAGESLSPDRFPFGDGVSVSSDLVDIAVRTAIEGGIEETIAAVHASEQLAAATDPAVRRVLSEIAEDESRHAELAWRTVAWAIAQGGDRVRAHVLAATAAQMQVAASAVDEADIAVPHHGLLSREERQRIRAHALRDVVLPCLRALCPPQTDLALESAPV